MPQKEHHEPLFGGVSAGENPFNFKEGELASMYNAIFRASQDIPIVGPKVVSKGTVTSVSGIPQGIEGLAACPFDSSTYLVAMTKDGSIKTSSLTSNSFSTSSPLDALTWSSDKRPTGFTAVPTDTTCLATAQYNNQYYLFSGLNSANLVLDSAGSVRQHGLQPVRYSPFVSVQTSWSNPNTGSVEAWGATGYYTYWYTEAIKDADGNLLVESDTDGDYTTTVNISNINYYTYINVIKVNTAATHWRLYRGTVTSTLESSFPNGEMVLETAYPATTVYDHVLTNDAFNVWTGISNLSVDNVLSWQNVSNITDGSATTYATLSQSGTGAFGREMSFVLQKTNLTSLITPLSNAAKYVTGISVSVKSSMLYATTISNSSVNLLFTSTTGWVFNPTLAVRNFTVTTSDATSVAGGARDLWGAPDKIPVQDFLNGNFKVRVAVRTSPAGTYTNPPSYPYDIVRVHDVVVKLYIDNPDSNGEPFETIIINGESPVSANSPPPVATCGAVYNDSLVLDDSKVPGRIRWSRPGLPESFPEPYYFDIPTLQNEKVTGMWVINNKLIVSTNNSMWRFNYLPLDSDVSFQKGQICDLLDPNAGCVGPNAAVVYSGMQGRPELVYMDRTGMLTTDGFTTRPACSRFSLSGWLTQMQPLEKKITLINDSEECNLFVFGPYRDKSKGNPYIPGVVTTASGYPSLVTACILGFNYSPRHLGQNGEFKPSGPLSGLWSYVHTMANNTVFTGFIYPGAVCLFRNSSILKEWGPGNVNLMLMGYTAATPTAPNAFEYEEFPVGKVCWVAPYRNFVANPGQPSISNAIGLATNTSALITRPMALESITGEFRTLEVYYGPRIETDSLVPKFRTFNIDQTSAASAYASLSSNNLTQKDVVNLFSTAQQVALEFTTNGPSDTRSGPHPHTNLLGSLLLRYDAYGKETR